MIELEDFKTVLAVVETGGVLKAAEVLHRVPSAVSMRIQNLENRLNTKLFEKQGRNIFPTSQALSLAEDARKILAQVQVAESKITKDRPGGIFRLGATDSLAGTRLSIPISRLLKRYPEIDFELKVASSEEIAEGILQRRLDAGILITEGRDERFSQTSLFREKLVIIAEKGSAPIKAASDIVGKTILAFNVTNTYHDRCLEWFLRAGMTPRRIIELPSYSAIIGSVRAGLGVAVVPLHWLEHFKCLDMVSVHDLPQSLAYVQVDFVHLKQNTSPNLKAMRAVLKEMRTD